MLFFFLPRVKFVPSPVTKEPMVTIVIQPVAAITTRPVTPKLARVTVQPATSARSRSQCTVLHVYLNLFIVLFLDRLHARINFFLGREGGGSEE